MKWKVVSVTALFAVAILAVVLASGRHSQAQATNPAPATYAYKVVPVRNSRELKDLERRLNDDARNGWRVCRVASPNFNDEIVVILEKPAGQSKPVCSQACQRSFVSQTYLCWRTHQV